MNFMFGGGMPFGMDPDDMPSGMGGGREPSGPVDNEGYYKILGISKDATQAEIRKAYRKKAVKLHPDKGGDPELFKELNTAHEVLKDEEKRKKYDKYGKEGLEEGGGGRGGDASDLFSAMFGGGGGGRARGPRKGENHVHPLKVSLEDLYKSRTVKLAITRNVLCSGCDGRGGKEGAEVTCTECRGRGMKVTLRQVGPGMISQSQSICPSCRGKKTTMREEDKCNECGGNKVRRDRKVLEVYIERGMKAGDKITFAGEADQTPGAEPGDVVFVVEEKPHDVFQRKGPDLTIKKEVSLRECLTGCQFVLEHLDGRHLVIKTPPGHIIKPGELLAVDNEGMPLRGFGEHSRGNLFVQFEIAFPKPGELSAEQLRLLKAALPPKPDLVMDDDMEPCELTYIDPSTKTPWTALGGEAYDSDEEEGGGGQRVQCANQ